MGGWRCWREKIRDKCRLGFSPCSWFLHKSLSLSLSLSLSPPPLWDYLASYTVIVLTFHATLDMQPVEKKKDTLVELCLKAKAFWVGCEESPVQLDRFPCFVQMKAFFHTTCTPHTDTLTYSHTHTHTHIFPPFCTHTHTHTHIHTELSDLFMCSGVCTVLLIMSLPTFPGLLECWSSGHQALVSILELAS